MSELKQKLERLFQINKLLDQELEGFASELTAILKNNTVADYADYDFVLQLLKTSGTSQMIAQDLMTLSLTVAQLSMKEKGVEFTKRLLQDIKNLHSDGNCNCEICQGLSAELILLEKEKENIANISKFNIN